MSHSMDAAGAETAAVLVGGLGTRLRSVLPDVPKPLAPVRGEPFLARLLRWLGQEGTGQALLLCGHGSGALQAFARSWNDAGKSPSLSCSVEPSPRGTGGAVRHALAWLPDEFVLVNGDSLCLASLAELKTAHAASGADMTILSVRQDDGAARGALECSPDGRVVRFAEKSRPGPGWINAGVYRMRRSLFEKVPAERAVSLEMDLLPRWISDGKNIRAHRVEAPFLDIGVPSDLERAQQEGWLS